MRIRGAKGEADELEVTPTGDALDSRTGRLWQALCRVLIGPPLRSTALAEERMRNRLALPVLAPDAISSVAYGPQAMMAIRAPGTRRGERQVAPDEVSHLVVVPVAALDLAALRALEYAASLSVPVLVLHVSPSEEEAQRFRGYWQAWGNHLPLDVVVSPCRATVAPPCRN